MDIHEKRINELKNGSSRAFSELYLIYADQVYGFALKLLKSTADAEDVLQDTFLRLWDKREDLSAERSLKAYLFQTAYHLVVDRFRGRMDSVELENCIESEAYRTAADETERPFTLETYRKQLNYLCSRLTPRQQEIFRLSREEGLSAGEIARRLGLSEKTVYNQLSLILRFLRSALTAFFFLLSCV
ncbi:MAG: sigma-70 family RNA polymerase sigma factor [Tannerella sp.]|nr:sigma-70 family RNA polymerase sigma factor [Tannerella sp.]